MKEQKTVCSSCSKRITNDPGSTTFACPKCGKEEITRCSQCRKLAVKYTCNACKFLGPN